MKRRAKLPMKRSKAMFRRTADRTHKFNLNDRPMRGGIRL
jgi:hypothetical protein